MQLVQSAVCVTASNYVNVGKDVVAITRAVYSTVSLVVTVVTVVMSKIIFRSWKRMKPREMARTLFSWLLLIQAVIGTSALGTTTKNMDMENLYARMGPGKIWKNHVTCFSSSMKFLPFWKGVENGQKTFRCLMSRKPVVKVTSAGIRKMLGNLAQAESRNLFADWISF